MCVITVARCISLVCLSLTVIAKTYVPHARTCMYVNMRTCFYKLFVMGKREWKYIFTESTLGKGGMGEGRHHLITAPPLVVA